MASCTFLSLNNNKIGDKGLEAFAAALARGHCRLAPPFMCLATQPARRHSRQSRMPSRTASE